MSTPLKTLSRYYSYKKGRIIHYTAFNDHSEVF